MKRINKLKIKRNWFGPFNSQAEAVALCEACAGISLLYWIFQTLAAGVAVIIALPLLSPPTATAQSGPASVTITSPKEGETVHSSDFLLLYKMEGDLAAAGVDHFHWKLSDGPNNTAPDLSGVVQVTGAADGNHTFTVYMATVDHFVINQRVTRNFRVVTTGATILGPNDGATVTTADVPLYYSTFGNLPAGATVRVSLDGGTEVEDTDSDGSYIFTGVQDGAHQLSSRLVDTAGNTIGDLEQRSVTVKTSLSSDNVAAAAVLAQKASKAKKKLRRKTLLGQLSTLLNEMAKGGAQNPAKPQLTKAKVDSVLLLASAAHLRPNDRNIARLRRALAELSG